MTPASLKGDLSRGHDVDALRRAEVDPLLYFSGWTRLVGRNYRRLLCHCCHLTASTPEGECVVVRLLGKGDPGLSRTSRRGPVAFLWPEGSLSSKTSPVAHGRNGESAAFGLRSSQASSRARAGCGQPRLVASGTHTSTISCHRASWLGTRRRYDLVTSRLSAAGFIILDTRAMTQSTPRRASSAGRTRSRPTRARRPVDVVGSIGWHGRRWRSRMRPTSHDVERDRLDRARMYVQALQW